MQGRLFERRFLEAHKAHLGRSATRKTFLPFSRSGSRIRSTILINLSAIHFGRRGWGMRACSLERPSIAHRESSQHVLLSGYQKVRHFGLAHPRAKTNWEWLSMLVTVTLNMVYVLTVSAKRVEEPMKMLCPECGGELRYLGMITSETMNMIKSNTS